MRTFFILPRRIAFVNAFCKRKPEILRLDARGAGCYAQGAGKTAFFVISEKGGLGLRKRLAALALLALCLTPCAGLARETVEANHMLDRNHQEVQRK